MNRKWITEDQREYRRVGRWECQDCLALLDDELAVKVPEAWHRLKIRGALESLRKAN